MFVYAFMCSRFDVEITLKMRRLLEFLKSYKNCFNFKNTKILSEYEDEDHAIDLVLGAKPLYDSFYTLSEAELDVLKD